MRQHVNEPTHVAGHTLDVLITRDTDSIVSNISVSDPGISDGSGKTSRDHYAVTFLAAAANPALIRKTVTYRKTKSIDVGDFRRDIKSSESLQKALETTIVDDLANAYTSGLTSFLDNMLH